MENPDWNSICMKYLFKIEDDDAGKYSHVLGKLGGAYAKRVSKDIKETKNKEKDEKFNEDPHYTLEGEKPNAVLISTDGKATLIIVKGFDDSKDLGEPLSCNRIDRVINQLPNWAENQFNTTLVGYVDANGISKGLPSNRTIQNISGYDYIAGNCVIVGMDDKYNYLPLHPFDAVEVWKYFNK